MVGRREFFALSNSVLLGLRRIKLGRIKMLQYIKDHPWFSLLALLAGFLIAQGWMNRTEPFGLPLMFVAMIVLALLWGER
jgi:hypothetical protein